MSDFRVASRYAKSLLDLAEEKGVLEEVHQDMLLFASTLEESRDFFNMLKNPIIKHDKKLKILKAIFSGKVHPMTISIFEIISRKNRESFLPGIATEFHHQYNIFKKVEEARVTTTFPLTDDIRLQFKQIVKQITGKSVELKEEVNPELIGGFILKIGDRQIDDSISSQLKELKLEFSQNPFIKEF